MYLCGCGVCLPLHGVMREYACTAPMVILHTFGGVKLQPLPPPPTSFLPGPPRTWAPLEHSPRLSSYPTTFSAFSPSLHKVRNILQLLLFSFSSTARWQKQMQAQLQFSEIFQGYAPGAGDYKGVRLADLLCDLGPVPCPLCVPVPRSGIIISSTKPRSEHE